MNQIKLRDLYDDAVYGGSRCGELLLAKLLAFDRANPPSETETTFLDFSGVKTATSSFLRTSVLAFRRLSHEKGNSKVVVCNLDETIVEELDFLLVQKKEAIVVCKVVKRLKPNSGFVIGSLEDKEKMALTAVLAKPRKADARIIAEFYNEDTSGRVTRWNNQLASLTRKGILAEEADGRKKLYKPVIEGLQYGT